MYLSQYWKIFVWNCALLLTQALWDVDCTRRLLSDLATLEARKGIRQACLQEVGGIRKYREKCSNTKTLKYTGKNEKVIFVKRMALACHSYTYISTTYNWSPNSFYFGTKDIAVRPAKPNSTPVPVFLLLLLHHAQANPPHTQCHTPI